MSRIFWDTNLFIYLFEDAGERADRVAALRQRMLERGDQLFASTLTLGGPTRGALCRWRVSG